MSIPIMSFVFSIFSVYIYRKKRSSNSKRTLYFVSFTVFYFIHIFLAFIYTQYLDYSLSLYDLNNDGFFTGEEITSEQESAMDAVTNDAGRSLAFIFGIFYASAFSFAVLAFELILHNLIKRR
ncbi:hypothetical protein CA267_010890 [Alteromonas pelagimontana]|uniref:Uncharacterized protein n=1 Tax=Alteromonas pelagimontana TaxID=1858656 RepID=A0A6M4MDJ2_9ALTE|nr:hypothetical protein [Alteromonas pelagimontana]QJR81251.1 hypothetical protein CA267_010890 [Alteromonas pelagimontana]